MKYTPLIALLFTAVLCSCHKNNGGDDNNNTTDNQEPTPTDTTQSSASLLTKTVLTSGTGTTTKNYQYDDQKRLVWYSNTSTKADYFEDTSHIIRAGDGHITQIVYYSDTSHKYNDPSLDSIVFNVTYDAGTSHYTDKIGQYKLWKYNFKDSTHYTYDANGHIVKQQAYYFDYKTTNTYQPSLTTDYTYDGNGNMTKLSTIYYKIDSVNDYPYDISYTYSTKGVNLLNLGNEAILLNLEQDFASHTPLTMVGNYPLNPEFNRNYKYYYTYNTAFRPLSAKLVDEANNNAESTLVYTYQ